MECGESNVFTIYVFAKINVHIMLLFKGFMMIRGESVILMKESNVWRARNYYGKQRKQAAFFVHLKRNQKWSEMIVFRVGWWKIHAL